MNSLDRRYVTLESKGSRTHAGVSVVDFGSDPADPYLIDFLDLDPDPDPHYLSKNFREKILFLNEMQGMWMRRSLVMNENFMF
jgi:hypothetical protein